MSERKSGILLHPTSLPYSAGIGTIGKSAFKFVDWLKDSGMKIWQVLPLGPTGYGDSPYQSFSAFALNPLLIDFDDLVEDGFASKKDVKIPSFIKKTGNVDYGAVVYWKSNVLKNVAKNFLNAITSSENVDEKLTSKKYDFFKFCNENDSWLKDYAAFMSIKSYYDEKANETGCNGSWNVYWDKSLANHDEKAVDSWINSHSKEFLTYEVIQFLAFMQWNRLKSYANNYGIEIIGDVPIFVAPDSADVWANQKLFQIDEFGRFKNVAGVPPDYFSAIGQLWGNPLYDWDAMKNDGYSWWIKRIKQMLKLVDYVRIDHFRGFESYWAVPAGSENAINGRWLKGPGIDLFNAIKNALGNVELPLIAEDLGIITDEVAALRNNSGLPGMKVIQFGFSKDEERNGALVNNFLPHNYTDTNCVVYTGTHDNDTTQGFLNSVSEDFVALIASYIEGKAVTAKEAVKLCDSGKLTYDFVKAALSSIAKVAIIPFQDIYSIGSEGRMNMPSTSGSNWSWRIDKKMLEGKKAKEKSEWLRKMCVLYNR